MIDENCKKALKETNWFNYIQTAGSEWRYRLYNAECGCNHFCASKNYAGFLLNSVELKEYEENGAEVSKRLSNIMVCGKNRAGLFDTLMNLFSVSIAKLYESGCPFFAIISLMKEKRQLLYFNFDELFVCLSDSEICELAEEYQIDVQKYSLIKEQNVYREKTDYFDLSVYDLW